MFRRQSRLSALTKSLSAMIYLIVSFASVAHASKIQVLTTTTELAWIAQALGNGLVEANSLLSGKENPHYVDATPAFALAARKSDLILAVGADLELGWLPRTLERSGNQNIQPQSSQSGYCEVSKGLKLIGQSSGQTDRSMGHVHAKGNPHFWYSMTQMETAAKVVHECFQSHILRTNTADSEVAATLQKNWKRLEGQFQKERQRLEDRIQKIALKNALVLEFHEDFDYLLADLGIGSMGGLEEKPGVKPSAGRLASVAQTAKERKARGLIYTSIDSSEVVNKFTELSSMPAIELQAHLHKSETGQVEDYFEVYWKNIEAILSLFEGRSE